MQMYRVILSAMPAMLVLAMLGTPSNAVPTVVDFEQFSGMPFENPAPVPASSRLYDQLLGSQGLLFTSGSSFVTVVNMGPDHAVSGVNTIAGSSAEGWLNYDRSDPVVISFFQPGNASVKATTDFFSIRGDHWASVQPITLNAYDINGNLIDTMTTTDLGGTTLQSSVSGIHSVELLGTANVAGVAWDDLTFNPTTFDSVPPIPPIPAPASAMLVLCGLGAMRAFRRLRQ